MFYAVSYRRRAGRARHHIVIQESLIMTPNRMAKVHVELKAHYPIVTHILIDLYQTGQLTNVTSIDIEPVYGHVGRIVYTDGSVRLFRNTNVGVNNHGASEISADKGYTKYFLQRLGYSTPAGKVFLLPNYLELIDRNLSRFQFNNVNYARIEDIYNYIGNAIGYPCFIKPNDGSQGHGVNKCYSLDDVQGVITDYQQEGIKLLLAEELIPFPDYRVVIFRNQVIACYLRRPLEVIGDGTSTISGLLQQKQQQITIQKRRVQIKTDDPRIVKTLRRRNITLETVPQLGEIIQIYDVSNLSAGGEAEDYTDQIHEHWRSLCIRIAADLGLTFCGIDLACESILDPGSRYSILETNASPGLDNYATSGERQTGIVRDLYKQIFNDSMNR